MGKLDEAKIRTFTNTTEVTNEGDGYWKAVSYVVERLSFDGETFEEKKLEAMSLDKDFSQAVDTALTSVLNSYNQETEGMGGTLFREYLDEPQADENPEA